MVRLMTALCSIVALLTATVPAGAQSGLVNLTFMPCGGMICLPVTLADGRSHVLLLDTGDVNSWLLADTARALGLTLEPIEQEGKALPGIFRLGVQTVSVQGRSFSGKFLSLGKAEVGELPPGVEGALAYTLFKDEVLQINYPHRVLRFLNARPAGAAVPGSELKLVTFGKEGPPIVVGSGFSVNGKALRAQIDTCFTGTLLVYDSAIGALGLQRVAEDGRAKYFPYTDGGVNMNEAAVEQVAFGDHVLLQRPASIYFSGVGRNPVHQPDGLFEATVGNALFAHSVVTLDFRTMKISVQPG
jgi:hypothetical protein